MRAQMSEGGIKYDFRDTTWEEREKTIDNLDHGNSKKRKKNKERQVVMQVLLVVIRKLIW
jgi:hypothetical protein